jgi:hypothetical protein
LRWQEQCWMNLSLPITFGEKPSPPRFIILNGSSSVCWTTRPRTSSSRGTIPMSCTLVSLHASAWSRTRW